MSGRGRKRNGGNNSSPRGMRQGSSFWRCPACGSDVHIALLPFHIASDCPVVGADDVPPAKAGAKELRDPRGTEQSPVGGSEFSVASASMGKQGIRQKLAWEEEEEDETPEEEKLQNRTSFSSGFCAREEKIMCLEPETPIQEGRDKIAVTTAMSASPSAFEDLKRSSAKATRKRLFEDYRQKVNREPEFVMQLSPADSAAAPSSPVDDPQAERPRVTECNVGDESRMVVDLDANGSESEGDDVAHVGMRSSVQDSEQELTEESVARQQVSDQAQKIRKEELEEKLDSHQEDGHGNCSSEAAVEIQDGEMLEAVVSEREEQLENTIRELRDQCSRTLLREIELQRALNVKNGECQRLRRLEQGSQEELLSARRRVLELETTLQELREEFEKLHRREEGLKEQLLSVRGTASELESTLHVLREECERLRRREQVLEEQLLSVRGRAFELEATLQEFRELVNKAEQKPSSLTDQSPPTQIYKEEEPLATQLLSQTSNSLASCCASPKAAKDKFDVMNVNFENVLEMDTEMQATQLLSDGWTPRYSPCIPVAGKTFQAPSDSRRVCGACTTDLPNATHEEFSLSPKTSPKTKLSSGAKSPVRRLLYDEGPEMTKASLKGNSESPLETSMTTAASALSPQTLVKVLSPTSDDHENAEGFDGNNNAILLAVGNQRTDGTLGGGPKTPEKFAVMLGFQEKGLISDMLDSFPPAQGTETQYGIDPFDDLFLEPLDKTVSNVTSDSKDPTEHPLQDAGTCGCVSGADQQFSHDDGNPTMLHPTEDIQEDTSAEMGPKRKRLKSAAVAIDSDDNGRPTMPQSSEYSQEGKLALQSSEDSQEAKLAEIGSKKKRRKNPVVLIDSDSDMDVGDEGIVHDRRRSVSGTEDSRKTEQDCTLSGTQVGKLDSYTGEQTSNPIVESCPGPAMASSRDGIFDQRRPPSPTQDVLLGFHDEEQRQSSRTVNVSFGMEGEEEVGEENATGIQGGCSRERSCSVDRPDPVVEALKRGRNRYKKTLSPLSVNVILSSSDEEDHICDGSRGRGVKKGKRSTIDEEDHITEGSRGSSGGKQGKRRRLVKVQELTSDGADSLQPEPIIDGTKGTGTKEVRRSGRLRNVYANGPEETSFLSDQEHESKSSEDTKCEDLDTTRDGSRSKPFVLDDDDDEEDRIQTDSNSSDGSPIVARHKHLYEKATQPRKRSTVRRELFGIKRDVDGEDDIDTDDSFIDDDPELDDVEPYTSRSVDEISDSGEESEKDGSSDKRKKYNWELEGDMLAALGKDTDLCLRGLCALYRRQEVDEKMSSSSILKNNVGFSKFHAARASNYASFLMGGVMSGPVLKTADEFELRFDERAVTYCSDICNHYSKQLFDIYQNNEDPYFPEPNTDPLP